MVRSRIHLRWVTRVEIGINWSWLIVFVGIVWTLIRALEVAAGPHRPSFRWAVRA